MKLSYLIELALGKKTAVFMIGGPASGKSTWVSQNAPAGFKVLDPDQINIDKFGAVGNQPGTLMKSHKIAVERMHKYIGQGKSFILDGTGSNLEAMSGYLNDAKKNGYKTNLVFLNIPLEAAIERNRERERRLPTKVVEIYWKKARDTFRKLRMLPWDEIKVIREHP